MKGSDTVGIGKGSRDFFEEHSDLFVYNVVLLRL